jgi:hypothetical protein
MKKLFALLLVFHSIIGYGQHYLTYNVNDGVWPLTLCAQDNDLLGVVIYARNICSDHVWHANMMGTTLFNWENADSIIIDNPHVATEFYWEERECYDESTDEFLYSYGGNIFFRDEIPSNPFDGTVVWKRPNETITFFSSESYDPNWSTGETSESIMVSEPGIYFVTLTNYCGPVTYSVEVRDNVELYRATCDLLTNKNKVTWLPTPEQAEYVSAVKVYRNNVLVATVPYTDGSFTDDIGSDATQWQYHLVAVSVEGDDCPIPSYWKRTIHLDHVQGTQGNHILQWTPYEEEESSDEAVAAYAIYDIVNGEAHHVIDVGNFTNVYSYNPEDFSGSAVVAAVFSDRGLEDYAFSNMISMTAVDETPTSKMVVYPNPSQGTFTVEGVSNLTVYNMLGQTIATCRDGACTVSTSSGTVAYQFTLPSGIYFVKSDEGAVRKVVVE